MKTNKILSIPVLLLIALFPIVFYGLAIHFGATPAQQEMAFFAGLIVAIIAQFIPSKN